MGKIFQKSRDDRYKKYFEDYQTFTKSFMHYSIKAGKITDQAEKARPWDGGTAGVPLLWSEQDDIVVVDQTDAHTLVIGPTGSKKSRLVAMPMVRILGSVNTKESMVICDPKAEIFNRTASFLEQQGYIILTLNLRNPEVGRGWNPLAIPYNFFCQGNVDRAYEFVNDIAENLIKDDMSTNEPFWDNSAGSLFFGLTILLFKYCFEQKKSADYVNIGNVLQLRNTLLSGPDRGRTSQLWKYAKQDPIIAAALIGTVETAKDTQAGILSTFDQKLRTFSMQPNILDFLAYNEIDLDEIEKKPTAIFMIVPDEKTGYHKLVSLFVKQSYEYIIYKAQEGTSGRWDSVGKLKRRVNYILDEFSSLPVISDFPAMITAARSRNIRFTLFIQSKHQLVQRYKDEAETIQTNCGNWIFLTSREISILQEISTLCGKINPHTPVLSESELQRLDKESGEVLLLSGRAKPFITHLPDIERYEMSSKFSHNKKWLVPQLNTDTRKMKLLTFQLPVSPEEVKEQEVMQQHFEDMLNHLLREHPELVTKNRAVTMLDTKESKLGG